MSAEPNFPATVKKTPWWLSRAAVIWGLLLLGPLALPFLLFSPDFKKKTKLILTAVTVVLTTLSAIYTPKLIEILMQRMDQLQAIGKG